ncbi:MAG: hypothetical protein ACHQ51_15105 [Elusimicrobiota bacterium]
MPPIVWNRAIEKRVDAVALSSEAALPGAREALNSRLKNGRYLAAAVLWRMDHDEKTLSPLLSVLAGAPAAAGAPGAALDEIAFVMRYARYRPAVPVLWKKISDIGSGNPYARIEYAGAIVAIDGDPRALDLLRTVAYGDDHAYKDADVPPSRLAAAYLKEAVK